MVFDENSILSMLNSKVRSWSISIICILFICLLWSCKTKTGNERDPYNENSQKSNQIKAIPKKLQELEKTLLDKEQDWRAAYCSLIEEGKPGWEIICKHNFNIIKKTEHLRQLIEVSRVPRQLRDDFWEYFTKQLKIQLENEEWAMKYAKALIEGPPYNKKIYWPPIEYDHLKRSYDSPQDIRLDVAILRLCLKKDFGCPWLGPKEKQQKAIKAWLKYIESTPNPWGTEDEIEYNNTKEPKTDIKIEEVPDDCIAIHIIKEGETLAGISEKYYGTPRYWRMILEVNPQMGEPRSIKVGMILKIPKLE